MFVSASVFPLESCIPATANRFPIPNEFTPIMAYDDPDDDEDWYDNDDEPDNEEPARCPECEAPVYNLSDRCPACGHWLSETERRRTWSGESKPAWIKITT